MKKVMKIIREYEDGSREFVEGDDLENLLVNEGIADAMALCGRVKYYPITWKKEKKV